jgi:hypothetical protein
MPIFFVAASLVILTIGYAAVALRERNFLNVLTPAYALFIPSNYLADLYTLAKVGPTASEYAYFMNSLA